MKQRARRRIRTGPRRPFVALSTLRRVARALAGLAIPKGAPWVIFVPADCVDDLRALPPTEGLGEALRCGEVGHIDAAIRFVESPV